MDLFQVWISDPVSWIYFRFGYLIQVHEFISSLNIWYRFKDLFQVWISDPGSWIYFRFGYLIQVYGFISDLDIWFQFMIYFRFGYLIQVHGFVACLYIWSRFTNYFQVWIYDPGLWIYFRFRYLIQVSWIFFRFGYLIQVQGFISVLDIWFSWSFLKFGYLEKLRKQSCILISWKYSPIIEVQFHVSGSMQEKKVYSQPCIFQRQILRWNLEIRFDPKIKRVSLMLKEWRVQREEIIKNH